MSVAMVVFGTVIALPVLSQSPPPVTSAKTVLAPQRASTVAQQQVVTVLVPDLIGDDTPVAFAKLRALGLRAGLTRTTSGSQPSGTVVRQSPAANTRVPKGSTVTLYLRPALTMPLVRGMLESDARTTLGTITRTVDVTYRDTSDAGLHNVVAQQKPDAGAPVQPQQLVALLVYRSVAPAMVVVPYLINDDLPTAVTTLRSLGLQAGLPRLPSGALATGIVSAQFPDAGARVPTKTTVKLSVRPQTAIVRVPDLLRLPLRAAFDSLRRVGLAVTRPTVRVDSAHAGLVISQQPTPNSIAQAGDTVHLVVGIMPRPVLATVPQVTGLDRSLAETMVRDSGFIPVTTISPGDSATTERVVAQAPTAGTRARRDSEVNLSVSRQMAPPPPVMPDVVGMLEDDARRALAFVASPIVADWEATTVEAQQSRVLGQSPAPRAPIPVDQPVRLRLGRYTPITDSGPASPQPQRTTVPDVVRRPYAEARLALDRARLALGRVRGGDTAASSVVVSQSPAPGMNVVVGSPVNLQLADSSLVRVPQLVGRSLRDATVLADLAGLNLTLGTAPPVDSSLTIGQQSPAAGALAPPNSAVLVVLTGGIAAWWWAIPLGLAALAGMVFLLTRTRPRMTARNGRVQPATPRVRLAPPDDAVGPGLESVHDPVIAHHVALIDQPVESGIDYEPDLILSTEDTSHE